MDGEGEREVQAERGRERGCGVSGRLGRPVLVGTRVRIYWKGNKKWFAGTVKGFDPAEKAHLVRYDDGDEQFST